MIQNRDNERNEVVSALHQGDHDPTTSESQSSRTVSYQDETTQLAGIGKSSSSKGYCVASKALSKR